MDTECVAVIIPYRQDDSETRSVNHVLQFYREVFSWDVWLADSDPSDPVFNKGQAINRRVSKLDEILYDVLLFNDADSLPEPHAVIRAVNEARDKPGLVKAFTRYRRLTRAATEAMKHWTDATEAKSGWEMMQAPSHGCVAVRRDCWESLGGYDERFRSWGYEDMACDIRYGARWPNRRITGTLTHLWHLPTEGRIQLREQKANLILYGQYLGGHYD